MGHAPVWPTCFATQGHKHRPAITCTHQPECPQLSVGRMPIYRRSGASTPWMITKRCGRLTWRRWLVEAALILKGETTEAASEAEQHIRGFLPDKIRRHAWAEQGYYSCRRCVDMLLLKVPMSPMPIVASRTSGGVDFTNHSISLGVTHNSFMDQRSVGVQVILHVITIYSSIGWSGVHWVHLHP